MKSKKINQVLGELEKEIMEVLWRLKNASVREVLSEVEKKKKLAYTTIMTVMSRLCDKKILKRKINGDTYFYSPVQDKKNFSSSISKKIISELINEFGKDLAISQFIDVLEGVDLKKSKELRKKLKQVI